MKKGNDKSRQPPLIAFFWPILWIALLLLLIIHACHMDYTWKNLLSDQNLCKLRTPLLIPILKFRLNTLFLGILAGTRLGFHGLAPWFPRARKWLFLLLCNPIFLCLMQTTELAVYLNVYVYNFSIFKWRFSLFELSRPNNADEKQLKWNTHGVIELPIS